MNNHLNLRFNNFNDLLIRAMLLLLASNTVNLFITPNPTAYSLFTTSFYQMDFFDLLKTF